MIILDWHEKGKKILIIFFFQNLGLLTKQFKGMDISRLKQVLVISEHLSTIRKSLLWKRNKIYSANCLLLI